MADSIADLRRRFYGGGVDAEKAFLCGNRAISISDARKGYYGAHSTATNLNIADLRRQVWGGGVDAEYAALSTAVADHFDGSSLDGAWTSAHTTYPSQFSAPTISGGFLTIADAGIVQDTYSTGPWDDGPTSPWRVGHVAIGRACGFTDNAEVTIRYEVTRGFEGLMQVGPMSHGNFAAVDVKQMGLNPFYDVSIASAYVQNVFRTPTLGGVKDPTYYTLIGGSQAWPSFPTNGKHTWTMRCVSGQVRAWHDGMPLGPKVALPAWASGRDFWGLHAVNITCAAGRLYPGTAIVADGTDRIRIESFQIRPYSLSLL